MSELATEKLNGNVNICLQHWVEDDVISGQGADINHSAQVLSTSESYRYLDGKDSGSISAAMQKLV